MAQSTGNAAISIHGNGKIKKDWIQKAYYRELREVFARNLPRYFHGRERIGMSLTGGLDTRMIMAWQRLQAGSLPCYTFGSMFRENQDVRVSRRVASICNQPHQVITAGQEFLSELSAVTPNASCTSPTDAWMWAVLRTFI